LLLIKVQNIILIDLIIHFLNVIISNNLLNIGFINLISDNF
jgi:hypothetical protein